MSYGEFTRVGDRVVFSMPLDSPRGERLQLVNLPASVVNWESTDQYAAATRYAQYVASRAESDYAVLTGQVASALNEIALAKDPARRLQIAEQARRLLAAWPAEHLGYRSADVNDMLSLLASTISELRGDTRTRQFAFDLVATIEPPSMPLLPDPTPTQAIEQVLLAARLSDVPAERITLLRSAISAIDEKAAKLPKNWAHQTRASAQATLDAELAIERRYAELSRATVARAPAAAAAADVRGVEKALSTLQARDRSLGGRRKDQVAGLLALLAGEVGFGPAPSAASRPVGPQGRGVSRVPGPCAQPDRQALEARAETPGRQVARGPRHLVSARSDAELRAHRPPARAHQAPGRSGPGARDAAVGRRTRAAGHARARACRPCRVTWPWPGTPRLRRRAR